MTYTIEMACVSHIGYVRENNEDNFCFDCHILDRDHGSMSDIWTNAVSTEKLEAVAIFDGMGGENAGETASFTAARKFCDICKEMEMTKTDLIYMMRVLNQAVCEVAREEKLGQIGTTATILFFLSEYAYLINVGDSPAYILRDGKLKFISEKHTNEELLKLSNITNRKPALTQFLGIPEDEMCLEPYIAGLEMQTGDVFLLCSDGLTDMVPEAEIQNILKRNSSVRGMAEDLKQEALNAGGRDNVTIVCCKVAKKRRRRE